MLNTRLRIRALSHEFRKAMRDGGPYITAGVAGLGPEGF